MHRTKIVLPDSAYSSDVTYIDGRNPRNVLTLAILDHERREYRQRLARKCSWDSWRNVCRQRIKNLAFLTSSHWSAIY